MRATLAIEEISDLILQTGYRKPILTLKLEDRVDIVATLIDYHLMIKVKSAMDQYMEGLTVLGLLNRVQQHPSTWKPLFMKHTQRLTTGTSIQSCMQFGACMHMLCYV